MSLDLTIFEFLLGLVGGTVFGVLIVKRIGRSVPFQKTNSSRKLAKTKPRAMLKQAKSRNRRPRSLRRIRSPVQPTEPLRVEPAVTTLAMNVSSCPTCGLQAPQALMAEHFLGSPSHEKGSPEPVVTVAEKIAFENPQALSSEEDAKNSLRSLMQMLVPPRAFGRRHQQRTVNPLSRLVQTIEGAQNAVVQPLKGPSKPQRSY
jgi:hypothetical protein